MEPARRSVRLPGPPWAGAVPVRRRDDERSGGARARAAAAQGVPPAEHGRLPVRSAAHERRDPPAVGERLDPLKRPGHVDHPGHAGAVSGAVAEGPVELTGPFVFGTLKPGDTTMTKIECIIRPERFEEVNALLG